MSEINIKALYEEALESQINKKNDRGFTSADVRFEAGKIMDEVGSDVIRGSILKEIIKQIDPIKFEKLTALHVNSCGSKASGFRSETVDGCKMLIRG